MSEEKIFSEYCLNVITKQTGCSLVEAKERLVELSSDQQRSLAEAAMHGEMHLVRNLLDLPIEEHPEFSGRSITEMKVGETVQLPGGDLITLLHVKAVCDRGGKSVPLIQFVVCDPPVEVTEQPESNPESTEDSNESEVTD